MKNKLPKYDNYKPSNVEWLGEIPQHWEVKRFKNNFKLGKGLTITKENLKEEGVLCVNYGEIHSKYGFMLKPEIHKLKCVDEEYLKRNPNSMLNNGDFIFADTSEDIDGSGNFTYLNSNLPVFAGYHTIIARPKANLLSKFLAFEFESLSFRSQIKSKVKGVKVYSITQSILNELSIWLPPLSEQEKIAQFLDEKNTKIDKAIEIKERQIELLKERRQILIHRAVTRGLDTNVPLKESGVEWIGEIPEHWEVKRLKYLIKDLESGVSVNASESESAENNEIGVLKTSCVYNYRFDFFENKKVFKSDLSRVSCPVRKDAIIISRMNAPDLVGASGYVFDSFPNLFLPDRLWQTVFYENIEVNVLWLSKVFIIKGFRDCITSIANGSSPSMKNISKGDFLNLSIPVPVVSEQHKISEYIENISAKISKAIGLKEREIEVLKEYKSSLINSAVTGKVKIG